MKNSLWKTLIGAVTVSSLLAEPTMAQEQNNYNQTTINASQNNEKPSWYRNPPEINMNKVDMKKMSSILNGDKSALMDRLTSPNTDLNIDEAMYGVVNSPELTANDLFTIDQNVGKLFGGIGQNDEGHKLSQTVAKLLCDKNLTEEEQNRFIRQGMSIEFRHATLLGPNLDFEAYKEAASFGPDWGPYNEAIVEPNQVTKDYQADICKIAATRKFTPQQQMGLAENSQSPEFDKSLISNPYRAQETLDYYQNEKDYLRPRERARLEKEGPDGIGWDKLQWANSEQKEIRELASNTKGKTNLRENLEQFKSEKAEADKTNSKTINAEDFGKVAWDITESPWRDNAGNTLPPNGTLLEIIGNYNLTPEQQMTIATKSCRPEFDDALAKNLNVLNETLKYYQNNDLTSKYSADYNIEQAKKYAEDIKNTATSVLNSRMKTL